MFNSLSRYFYRKYRVNLGKNKQKCKKNEFFIEKKCVLSHFSAKKQIFFVILPRKQHRDDMYRDLLTIER